MSEPMKVGGMIEFIESNVPADQLGDAWDEPDIGEPPCVFCRRAIPCECAGGDCMCTCGRCLAPPLPDPRPRV
jgi:hypothetical protein